MHCSVWLKLSAKKWYTSVPFLDSILKTCSTLLRVPTVILSWSDGHVQRAKPTGSIQEGGTGIWYTSAGIVSIGAKPGHVEVVVVLVPLCSSSIQPASCTSVYPSVSQSVRQYGSTAASSGIIADREDEVALAYAAAGLERIERRQEGDWVALVHRRGTVIR